MCRSAAVDRAEYSLHEGTIVIALAVGGLALAAMGILRLFRVAFAYMPAALAATITVAGLLVGTFAVYVSRAGLTDNAGRQPVVSLAPALDGPVPAQLGDVHVTVRTRSGPVPDASVTLESRFAIDETPKKLAGRTDANGRVTFAKVDISPGSPWIAVAHYAGRDFPSTLLRSARSTTIEAAPVMFDPKRITVGASSTAIVGDTSGMQVVQAMTLVNHSSRAFAGGLSFPLLSGATAIDPRTGLDRAFLTLDNRNQMVSSAPVLPGSHEFTYTYVAPVGRTGAAFRLDVSYGTNRYDVLVGGKLDLRPQGKLRRNGKVTLGGRTYLRYTARHLAAGQHVTGRIALRKPSHVPTVAILVVAIALALAIIALPLLRRRRQSSVPLEAPRQVQPEWT